MTTTATFSTLLRNPNGVIEQLEDGDVLLTRRDAEPLRLTKAVHSAQEAETLGALAQLIASTLLSDDSSDHLASRLSDPFPWIEFLPEGVRRDFVAEFLRIARACASVGRFDRLTVSLNAWRATAEAYANPRLTATGEDLVYLPVPAPTTDPREGS